MKACPDRDHLMAYVDDLLDQKEKEEIANHLKECQSCLKEYNSMRELDGFLHQERIRQQLKQVIPTEWGCPDEHTLNEYFCSDLDDPEKMDWIKHHLEACQQCSHKIARMEQEVNDLIKEDPLKKEVNWTSLIKEKVSAAIEIFIDQAQHLGNIGTEFITQVMLPTKVMELEPVFPEIEEGPPLGPIIEESVANLEEKIDIHELKIETDNIPSTLLSLDTQIGAIKVSVEPIPEVRGNRIKIILLSEEGKAQEKVVILGDSKKLVTFQVESPGQYLVLIQASGL